MTPKITPEEILKLALEQMKKPSHSQKKVHSVKGCISDVLKAEKEAQLRDRDEILAREELMEACVRELYDRID